MFIVNEKKTFKGFNYLFAIFPIIFIFALKIYRICIK